MSKKIKGVILDQTTPYGVGLYVDDKARMKYQTLMQDYHELQKDVDMMRSRLEAGKQRKTILAAEVRFLRKRFGSFVKTNLSQKKKLVQPPNLHKQMKHTKEFSRTEVRTKKKQHISKEAGTSQVIQHRHNGSTTVSNSNRKGKVDGKKNNLMWNTAPVVDLNKKERMHASAAFDLNQYDDCGGKESPSMQSRAPIFDLNEISTGDEDFETAKRGIIREAKDEVEKELMLCVGRNGNGVEGRKRKISWQDPVALTV